MDANVTLPGLFTVAWLLAIVAIVSPRWQMALVAVGGGGALLALWGEPSLLIVFMAFGGFAFLVMVVRRRRLSPSLDELAMLAEYLTHQLISGVNLSQALYQAGQEASRTPPTLMLPVLGRYLSQQAQMMQTGGVSESQALRQLGEQFQSLTVRSFFNAMASVAQHVSQDGVADALGSMAERVKMYRDMDKSFQSKLAIARMTRYVMLILVPGLMYFISFHSPLMEGGLLNNPLGIPLILFDGLLLGLAVLVGNWLSSIQQLEF